MARNEFGPHYRSCGWVLGDSGLWACDFGAASGIDLLAVRGLFSLFGLHLAEFPTKEIMVGSRDAETGIPPQEHPRSSGSRKPGTGKRAISTLSMYQKRDLQQGRHPQSLSQSQLSQQRR